jgi:LysM repeat protein
MSANSPNPLIPQGSLEKQTSKAKSNVKVAVYSIVAVHAVLIFGVLMQGGCKKDEPKPTTQDALTTPSAPMTSTNDGFYGNPGDAGHPVATPTTPSAPVTGTTDQFGNPISPVGTAPVTTPTAPVTPGVAPTAPTVVDTGMSAPAAPLEGAGSMQQYKVVKGDVAYTIAKKNKTTVAKLTAANPGVDIAKLKIGQTLNVPAAATAPSAPPATATASTVAAPAATGSTTTYEVKSGDTLYGISKKTGASVKAIRAANNLKVDRINVGQKLKIPVKASASAPAAPVSEPVITAPASVPTPSAPMTTTSAPTPVRPRTL